VSDLQPAFHIHHLFEIQDALEKVKEPQKVMCGKCKKAKQAATSYCRDCGEFICAMCTSIHSNWDDFAGHEVVALEQLESKMKELDALKKVTFYCSLHKGKELEIYCETCEELICHNCTVTKHCRPEHKYSLVDDTFEQHKTEIVASLEPIEKQVGIVNKALEELDQQSAEVDDQRGTTKSEIARLFRQIYDVLEARKADLDSQVDQLANQKLKNLATQKDEVETVQTQLASCLSFVRESLRTGSQGEVMKMKKTVMKQIKEMTDNFKPDMLPPCEPANVRFVASPELIQICQKSGEVYWSHVCPEKCYATGKGLEAAKLGERATAVLKVIDQKGKVCSTPVETLTCELVSESTGEKIDCSVKKTEASGQYEISYQATSRGRHQLHIKVEGEHIKGSPFTVTVNMPVKKLGAPIKTISGVKYPYGMAINQREEIIVAERYGHCISVFSPTGEKFGTFGSLGSGPGQFSGPRGVAVDDDGNILVADTGNHRIQKFTSDNKHITSIGSHGSKELQFNTPTSVAISPITKKIAISDWNNCRVQILNPDLTFHSSIGSKGSGNGEFNRPHDVAFDSAGNIYVTDSSNNRIQVCNPEGQVLRHFGNKGKGDGELDFPVGISIDSDDTVYVVEARNHCVSIFTHDGKFVTSFGSQGDGPGHFKKAFRIVVNKNGMIYVADSSNNRIQIF
jgi:tripartite motif-containing protein 2/3/tripartite motif-containing protein 71